MNEDVIVLIPARAGSKGIKNKNKLLIGGKPLFQWSVEFAIDEKIPLDNIIVSSDDEDILNISAELKVVSLERPRNLSEDETSTEAVIIHVLDYINSSKQFWDSEKIKYIAILQPTSPIRFKNRLNECLNIIRNGNYDSLLTTKKMCDLFWMEMENLGKYSWVSSYLPQERKRKQEMLREDFKYFDNGNIYVFEKNMFLEKRCRIGNKTCVFAVSDLESIQIDNMLEFESVNAILSKYNLLKYTESNIWNGALSHLKSLQK